MSPPSSQQEVIYDLVGLGFGPANIAVAGALTETWQCKSTDSSAPVRKVLFIEKHKTFQWHPGMLLPEARMQISFMKDLATLRNPHSPYTFLSYLHSQGRLVSFINRGSMIPTRKEYSDYLGWAAQRIQDSGVNVLYGHEIVGIEEAAGETIEIRYRNLSSGEESFVQTKNVVISPGGSPRVPRVISPVVKHPCVIHSSAYATSIGRILESVSKDLRPLRIAVIGSGQSAAEVTLDVRSRLSTIPSTQRHNVDMLIRKGCLKPSDDSPFANEIFDPTATDTWFSLSSEHLRERKLAEYKLTNYGVVNPRTLENFYEVIYDQRLNEGIAHRTGSHKQAGPLIDIKPYTFIVSVQLRDAQAVHPELLLSAQNPSAFDNERPRLIVKTQNMMSRVEAEVIYDAIIYATGYERSSWVELLKVSSIGKHFGLSPLSSSVRLVPSSNGLRCPTPTVCDQGQDRSVGSSNSSSAESSPPTSPELGGFSSGQLEGPQKQHIELAISRNYRLLPLGFNGNEKEQACFGPRIYLQGVEEYTHGLSDTLLSVLGVRAGEVVGDICAA